MKYSRIFFFAIALLSLVRVTAQDSPALKERGPVIPGFIFNTGNILMDLGPYEGGVGLKLMYPDFAIRTSMGGGYEGSTDKLDLVALFAIEKPFYPGLVTPYWGADTYLCYSQERVRSDADNWSLTQGFSASLGVLTGLEILITDYISVFAEYALSGCLAWSNIIDSVNGTLSETSATNFKISTGLNNNASLGVVVYMKPTKRLPEQEKPKGK